MRRTAPLLLAVIVLSACATSTGSISVRSAGDDLPSRFMVVQPDGTTVPARDDGQCRSPLVDPRDGTRLTMVRSTSEVADYAVPDGRYGVRDGELLRVSCDTGETVGVVRR